MQRDAKQLATVLLLALVAASLGGCAGPARVAQPAPTQQAPAHPSPVQGNAAEPPASQEPPALAGKVVETMNAGGYSYICLENSGKKIWAAVPVTQVAVGDELELQPGMVMTNFSSKSLGRTFEAIIFSGGLARKK